MERFLMLGRETELRGAGAAGGNKSMSAVMKKILKEHGGKLEKAYANLGQVDVVLIVTFANEGSSAIAAVSKAFRQHTGYFFQSSRLLSLEDAGLDSGFPHIHINAPHILDG